MFPLSQVPVDSTAAAIGAQVGAQVAGYVTMGMGVVVKTLTSAVQPWIKKVLAREAKLPSFVQAVIGLGFSYGVVALDHLLAAHFGSVPQISPNITLAGQSVQTAVVWGVGMGAHGLWTKVLGPALTWVTTRLGLSKTA